MRIMTSNIWGDYFGNPVDIRKDNLCRVFAEFTPDVIGLQEVTPSWHKSGLLEELSKNYFLIHTNLNEFSNYVPLAVNKKYTVLSTGYEPLDDTPDKSKGITFAVIQDGDNIFGVCNTHFWYMHGAPEHDLLREKNAYQLIALIKKIRAEYNCPVFAFGDLNCNFSSSVFSTVFADNNIVALINSAEQKDTVCSIHGDPVADQNGIYHGKKTERDYLKSIDHIIALAPEITVKNYRVIENQYALDFSDHSPVFADVNFK